MILPLSASLKTFFALALAAGSEGVNSLWTELERAPRCLILRHFESAVYVETPADLDLGRVEVNIIPTQPQKLTSPHSGVEGEDVERLF